MKNLRIFFQWLILGIVTLMVQQAHAQQFRHDEKVYEIEEGVEYLLVADVDYNDKGRYFTQDSWNYLSRTATDAAMVTFVSVGEQSESGDELYALMFVATGEYVMDQQIFGDYDGADMLGYSKPYIFTTSNVDEAAKWTVKLAETRYRKTNGDDDYWYNWSVWTDEGEGEDYYEEIQNKTVIDGTFVLMNKHTNDWGTNPIYLETAGDYALFASHGQNAWFIYTPREMSAGEILDEYMNEHFPEGVVNYYVGDCPGQYEEASVNAVREVYAKYEAYALDGVGDPEEILVEMKEAMANLVLHEMREGYYYIQPNRRISSGLGEAGLVFDEEGAIRVQAYERPETLTLEASKYVWYFKPAAEADVLDAFDEPKENAYYIQNYGTSKWATNVIAFLSGNREMTFTTGDKAAVYVFEYLSVIPGTVYIYTHESKGQCTGDDGCPYCAAWNVQNHSKNYIIKWNARWDEGNMMFLYPVAQEEVDAIRDQVAQFDINERLRKLVSSIRDYYNTGFVYNPAAACTKDDDFTSHGLFDNTTDVQIKAVNDKGEDVIHPSDGSGIPGMLDGDPTTYGHTYWAGEAAYPHYFEVDLGAGNELDAISVKMMRRTRTTEHNANFSFGEAKVFGRNHEDDDWAEVAMLRMTYNIDLCERNDDGTVATDDNGQPIVMDWGSDTGHGYVGTGCALLGGKYRYLRFQHYKAINGDLNTYFSAAEWALFEGAALNEGLSPNCAVSQAVNGALLEALAQAEEALSAGQAAETHISRLQAAYEAYCQARHANKVFVASADEQAGRATYVSEGEQYVENVGYCPVIKATATPNSGYKFTHWTYNDTLVVYDNPYIFVADTTVALVAHFESNIKTYPVIFDVDGVTTVDYLPEGAPIEAPEVAEKEGHTFIGWDPALEDGATVPNGGITYTAQWQVNQYTIYFDSDGGSTVEPITLDYGTIVNEPTAPVKDGYAFLGWEPQLPETMPANDVYVKANWGTNAYTVTFLDSNGEVISSMVLEYGSPIEQPEDPAREGHTFLGWDQEVPSTMPAYNLTLTAQWQVNQYTITFDDGNGGIIEEITQDYGTEVTSPLPAREGYSFLGWDKEVPTTMPAEDMVITAQWQVNQYTITFKESNGKIIERITQDYGTEVVAPTPTKEGYTFVGWNKEVPATMPAQDMSITAQWQVNQYTITVRVSNGKVIERITLDYGTTIVAPTPTKEGYTFVGWNKEVPATMPAEDMSITALWEVNQYTITFDSNGGTDIPAITQDYGTPITAPAEPTREGYTFLGWDTEIPATMPASNLTITAQWQVNQYRVTFISEGEELMSVMLDYGTTITPPQDPEREGHTFLGWSPEVDATVPAHDVTYEAQFEVNIYTIIYYVNGEAILSESLAYGDKIKPYEPALGEGETFSGWDIEIPETMPAQNLNVYGTINKVDAITDVLADGKTELKVYTLDGKFLTVLKHKRDLNKLNQGIYIINGVKVYVP
ncbi:MAG: InlB B-repeat-containing protein [Bacteroidaceae bacterium]|nr:InlB B-repeat-containing protein [Bacteroidaceae bacterium]